jgi:signal transduction histidine kinase
LQGRHDELRELADRFDDMLDRLDRAFASQRQFIADASHELRTPLTVMRTSVDVVLAKPAPTPAELTGMAIEVRMAVDRAELLLDALLTLARSSHPTSWTDCFCPSRGWTIAPVTTDLALVSPWFPLSRLRTVEGCPPPRFRRVGWT